MVSKPTKVFSIILIFALILSGCMGSGGQREDFESSTGEKPVIPEKLKENDEGIPLLSVYNTGSKTIEEMDLESYIMGVVAGEMKNDWPMEALKAQAILARTFTLKFVSDKSSAYEGADISTDVKEAQAYNADAVNDRVREAVNATKGVVMAIGGDLPYAWFHAHSGGMTELPSKALEYKSDPSYLTPVNSMESDKAPENVKKWTAEFSLEEAEKACEGAGVKVGGINRFDIGEMGVSGRTVDFIVNDKRVSAPSFRLQIGSEKLKSTMIDDIVLDGDVIRFTGRGFGHGVGMSQWGAYGMAEEGKSAEEIVHHYFTGVELVELW